MQKTQSVNTIYKKKDKIVGDNTDVKGFQYALRHIKYSAKGKKIFHSGSRRGNFFNHFCLEAIGVSKIMLSNRTKEKAENLKKIYPDFDLIKWGDKPKILT